MYRELVLDIKKIAIPRNRVVKVVSAGRITKVERSERLGGVWFLLYFLIN